MMAEKRYKWIVPQEIPIITRLKGSVYPEALEYLAEVKVRSRYELREKFSHHVVRRLLRNENVGFVNLLTGRNRGSLKYKITDLFNVNRPFNNKLFIIYLKGEEEALADYISKLIKLPLDSNKMKAMSKRLASLNHTTKLNVIQKTGYTLYRKYGQCVEEFLKSGLESARVNLPGVKPRVLSVQLGKSVKKRRLNDKIAVRVRQNQVFLVRLE